MKNIKQISLWTAGLALITLVQTFYGLGWKKVIPLDVSQAVNEEKAWVVPVHPSVRKNWNRWTPVQVTEEGRPLITAKDRPLIKRYGGGQAIIKGGKATFAPWDDSDPRQNGRAYHLTWPVPIPWWLTAGLFLISLVAQLVHRDAIPKPCWLNFSCSTWWVSFGTGVLILSLLRLALWWRGHPHSDNFMVAKGLFFSDAMGWLEIATFLSKGYGLTGLFSTYRPFYTVLLGALGLCGGSMSLLAVGLNAVSLAATSVFLAHIMSRWLGVFSGWALALWVSMAGSAVLFLPLPMTETAAIAWALIALGVLWWALRPKSARGYFFLAGLLLGISQMINTFALLSLPLLAILIFGLKCRAGSTWQVRQAILATLIFTAGATLVIGPWLVRQKFVIGFSSLTSTSMETIYATVTPAGKYSFELDKEARAAGVPDDLLSRHQYYSRQWLAFVKKNPGQYLQLIIGHIGRFLHEYQQRDRALLLLFFAALVSVGLRRTVDVTRSRQIVWIVGAAGLGAASLYLPAAWWWLLISGLALASPQTECRRWSLVWIVFFLSLLIMAGMTAGVMTDRMRTHTDIVEAVLALMAVVSVYQWSVEKKTTLGGNDSDPSAYLIKKVGLGFAAVLFVALGLCLLRTAIGPSSKWLKSCAEAAWLEKCQQAHPEASLVSEVITTEYQTTIHAKENLRHWSHVVSPQSHERTVALMRLIPSGRLVPVEFASPPAGKKGDHHILVAKQHYFEGQSPVDQPFIYKDAQLIPISATTAVQGQTMTK